MQFNEKLKKLRADKGLSQEELAKKIFVSRSAVAKWENGLGLPGEASLNALAEFFSVSKDELLYDKETETLIVEKNITISKSKKSLIVVCLVSFTVILSFILSLFLLPKSNGVSEYTIQQTNYQNIKQLNTFCQSIEQTIHTDSDTIYMKNGGVIRTDETGNILYVNIDVFVSNKNELYAVQIQKQEASDYTIIKEPLKDIGGERVLLNDILNSVSLWEFTATGSNNIKFVLNTVMTVNLIPSENINQKLYENGLFKAIEETQNGLFSKTIVLTDNQIQSEIYIKIKG